MKLINNLIQILLSWFIGNQYAKNKQAKELAKGLEALAKKQANARLESTPDRLRRIAKRNNDNS
jgi:uncharacterized membrane protein affecting hemolysin expression